MNSMAVVLVSLIILSATTISPCLALHRETCVNDPACGIAECKARCRNMNIRDDRAYCRLDNPLQCCCLRF
ncbi:hypothetical protein ACP4OV_002083 [Aristida adscensionis]